MVMTSRHERGFTLIEVVITIIILGILSGVAVRQLNSTVSTAQFEQTKQEMEALSQAIVGNPMAYSAGTRVDFGYVGDVGAMPPNLDALVQNPGAYATWKGPYLSRGKTNTDFKLDGWGTAYVYQDTLIRSTGSGSTIEKVFASSTAELLQNSVSGVLYDAKMSSPGGMAESVLVEIRYPNGAGGLTTASINPESSGSFSLTGIPIGVHQLRVINQPSYDTISLPISVYPKKTTSMEVVFPVDLW
jgi:general secretion pathway protein G